jgi:RNA polymerase sigma-70 factor (ECF subfamily)
MEAELEDIEIVTRVREGQRDLYGLLVQRYQQSVYNLAYRMTGNHADATDMAQEAFIRAYKKLNSYKPTYSFRNWVMSICANQSRNLFRKRSRRQRVEQEIFQYAETEPAGHSDAPGLRDDLSFALQALPEKLRIAVTLKHVEELSYDEISEVLGVGVSAAKMRVKRGIQQLCSIMNSEKEGAHV